jgi:N-acetylmuramoyl-L-alanine amidase
VRTFGRGARGDHVRDLQWRLARVGYPSGPADGRYGEQTEAAVIRFQQARGLDPDGVCGPLTWTALLEAGHRLGARRLYLRFPMMRGDDVAELQARLGRLGFDAGRVDGVFGPDTLSALEEFQRNVGIAGDGICGSDTVAALLRLGMRVNESPSVAELREQESHRQVATTLSGARLAVGENGGLDSLTAALRRALAEAGAQVLTLHHPDWSVQARRTNEFAATAYIGCSIRRDDDAVCYFATDGFESRRGHRLAAILGEHLVPVLGGLPVRGMRLPILRETKAPAVLLRFSSADRVVTVSATVAQAVRDAVRCWLDHGAPPRHG